MIVERFAGLAQLPDEDKMTLMAELWKDVMGEISDDNPALADLVEQRWREYLQQPLSS